MVATSQHLLGRQKMEMDLFEAMVVGGGAVVAIRSFVFEIRGFARSFEQSNE